MPYVNIALTDEEMKSHRHRRVDMDASTWREYFNKLAEAFDSAE